MLTPLCSEVPFTCKIYCAASPICLYLLKDEMCTCTKGILHNYIRHGGINDHAAYRAFMIEQLNYVLWLSILHFLRRYKLYLIKSRNKVCGISQQWSIWIYLTTYLHIINMWSSAISTSVLTSTFLNTCLTSDNPLQFVSRKWLLITALFHSKVWFSPCLR